MWIKIGSNMRVSLKYHDNKLTSTTTHLRGMPVFAHDFKMVMEKKKKMLQKKIRRKCGAIQALRNAL